MQCDGLILLASLYQDLGAPDRARSSAEEALALAQEIRRPDLERAAEVGLGRLALLAGNGEAAAGHFARAIEMDEQTASTSNLAEDHIGRGAAWSLLGRDEDARNDLRRASAMFAESGRESLQWVALVNLADTFEESDPDSAAWYYEAALTSLEHRTDSGGGEALNTGYLFSRSGKAYEEITLYFARRHQLEPEGKWDRRAFETAERSRARGLLELFEDSFALDAGPEAQTLIDSLYQLDTSTAEGRQERDRVQQELAELRRARQAESSGGTLGLEPVGLRDVQRKLPRKTALLQYALGDSTSLLWVVDRRKTSLVQLPGRDEIQRRVRAFRDAIAQPGVADAQLLQEGRELFELLLAPAADRLAANRNLVIVPDGVLFELPFEALLEDTVEGPWSEQPFFGRDHAPVYAPSSTVYLELRKRGGKRFNSELLALGDADYSALDETLEPLPFTGEEVRGIAAELDEDDSTVLLGKTATESDLRAAMNSGSSRVIHLATHGLIDPAEPSRSCVALAPGSNEDGYLYSMEILALDLESPMIVLSACESALGKLERGEGVVGLTRSFLAAGAQGVVASLWPVSDASTATLMSGFYTELWQRNSAAESLHHARLELLSNEEWSHPYFWAAFVMIGTERMPW